MILTNAETIRRSASLIPNARSGHLSTHSAGVSTPAGTVPGRFRAGQEARTAHYMTTTDRATARTLPADSVRFWVESYGVPIAWVTLDGSVGYANGFTLADDTGWDVPARQWSTMLAHRDAVRAAWPDRFPQTIV